MSKKGPVLHRINLVPKNARGPAFEVPAKALPAIIVATLLVLSFAGVSQQMSFKSLRSKKEEIAAKQKELNDKIDVLTLEKNSVEIRQKQVSTIQQIQARKISWSDLFKELSLLISKDIWLSAMQAQVNAGKRMVTLEGAGETPMSVSMFFQALELSYFFRRVMLVTSTLDEKTYPPLYRYKFSVPIDEGAKDAVATSAAAPSPVPAGGKQAAAPKAGASPAPAAAEAAPAPSPSATASPAAQAKEDKKEEKKADSVKDKFKEMQ